jgi:hypothetical protein
MIKKPNQAIKAGQSDSPLPHFLAHALCARHWLL